MIRVTKLHGTWYGIELSDDNEKEMDEIQGFVEQGTVCIIVDSLEDLESLGIDENITMVERD